MTTTAGSSAPAFFRGVWIEPGHPEYEAARPVFNHRVDVRPEVIARCAGVADVVAAVRYARERGLAIDVRSTGFRIGGPTAISGLVIDLSLMRGIQILPGQRIARIQGGIRGGDLQVEAAPYGLAGVTGAISEAGVGLMLGGGIGHLAARAGYASDNILAAEVVTATGDVVTASPDENPDLFWAVRGSTGNFGVATALEVRLHEVPPLVHAGMMVWYLDNHSGGVEVLRTLPDWASDDLSVMGLLAAATPDSPACVQAVVCHSGPEAQARAELEHLRSFGTPDEDSITALPFRDLSFLLDDMFAPCRAIAREQPVTAISDELVDALVSRVREPAGGGARVVEIIPRRGAFGRAPELPHALRETAWDPTWCLGAACWYEDESEDEKHARWVDDVYATIRRIGSTSERRHPSGVGVTLDLEDRKAMYGDNFARLRDLKRKWDPDNVFVGLHNIPPARG